MLSPHPQPFLQQHLIHMRSGIPGQLQEGEPIHPDFSALISSPKRSHKLILLLPKRKKKKKKKKEEEASSFYWLLGAESSSPRGWCSLTPCLGKHGSRLSLRSRGVLYTGHVSQTNWRRLQRNHLTQRLEMSGPQSPVQRLQSQQNNQRKKRLGPHWIIKESATALTRRQMLQREGYGSPELNQQKGGDREECWPHAPPKGVCSISRIPPWHSQGRQQRSEVRALSST